MILRALLYSLFLVAATPTLAQEDDEREGGIIGTGIVGTITNLGSIIVNSQRITFEDELPVSGAVPAMTAKDLTPGLTVAVVATPEGEDWQALNIRQVLPLVGPIDTLSAGQMTVMGTVVTTDNVPDDLSAGDWVAVSGLWRGTGVVASAITRLPGAWSAAKISGTYLGSDENGHPIVGGTTITGLSPSHLSVGDLVRVEGVAENGVIRASRLETGLFDERVGLVQVQGYYSPPQPDGLYTVLGSGLVAYTEMPEMISQTDRVITCGAEGILTASPETKAGTRLGCQP